MPYCPNCGKEVPQSDKFCKYCGANLSGSEVKSNPAQVVPKFELDERIVGVIPHLVQGSRGIASTQWTLVATNRRIIIAQLSAPQMQEALALSKARAKGLSKLVAGRVLLPADLVEFTRKYFKMSPSQILGETPSNLSFDLDEIRRIWVDYELDPKDEDSHIRMDRYKLVISVSERGQFTYVFDADPQDVAVLKSVVGDRLEGEGRQKAMKPPF
jgi:hypothetical protein